MPALILESIITGAFEPETQQETISSPNDPRLRRVVLGLAEDSCGLNGLALPWSSDVPYDVEQMAELRRHVLAGTVDQLLSVVA